MLLGLLSTMPVDCKIQKPAEFEVWDKVTEKVPYLWTPIHSNGQVIVFYSCDVLFFCTLIFEAEECCPTGPLPGCGNVA